MQRHLHDMSQRYRRARRGERSAPQDNITKSPKRKWSGAPSHREWCSKQRLDCQIRLFRSNDKFTRGVEPIWPSTEDANRIGRSCKCCRFRFSKMGYREIQIWGAGLHKQFLKGPYSYFGGDILLKGELGNLLYRQWREPARSTPTFGGGAVPIGLIRYFGRVEARIIFALKLCLLAWNLVYRKPIFKRQLRQRTLAKIRRLPRDDWLHDEKKFSMGISESQYRAMDAQTQREWDLMGRVELSPLDHYENLCLFTMFERLGWRGLLPIEVLRCVVAHPCMVSDFLKREPWRLSTIYRLVPEEFDCYETVTTETLSDTPALFEDKPLAPKGRPKMYVVGSLKRGKVKISKKEYWEVRDYMN